MSMPTEMTAAAAVADSKLPPGEEYEEIREQVRNLCAIYGFGNGVLNNHCYDQLGVIPC